MTTAVEERVREAVATVESVVSGLEPGELLASQAAELVEAFATLEHVAAAGKVLCAKRAAEVRRVWSRKGDKSPAHWLARTTGTTVGDAVGLLEVAEQLTSLPVTAEAFKRGELSPAQAKVVTDAATVAPGAEPELLAQAGRASLQEMKDTARAAKAAADPTSAEERHRRLHRERELRTWIDADGAGCGSWRTTPDQHARIVARLQAHQQKVFAAARTDGRRERPEAYAVDALDQLLGGADADRNGDGRSRGSGADAKVIVRVDHAALVRGAVGPGETCDIAGIGPVPVSVVRDWIDHDAFLAAIVTDGTDVSTAVHLGRRPTALQRTALQWSAPTCSVEGCATSVRLEIDHRDDWARTHRTVLWSLDRLCAHHHDLKTRHGYRLAPGTGSRPLRPPDEVGGRTSDAGTDTVAEVIEHRAPSRPAPDQPRAGPPPGSDHDRLPLPDTG